MTIYARPEMFIDTTPTFAQNIAGSLGTLAGKGIDSYLKNQASQKREQLIRASLEEKGITGALQDLFIYGTEGGRTDITKSLLDADRRNIEPELENIEPSTNPDASNSGNEEPSIKPNKNSLIQQYYKTNFGNLSPIERSRVQRDLQKGNDSYFKDDLKRGQRIPEEARDIELLQNLNESGKLPTGLKKYNIGIQSGNLIIPELANAETTQYVKTLQKFLRGLKDTYGARITNLDVDQYIQGLPKLSNSEEGRRVVLRQMQIANQINQLYYSVQKDIINKYGNKLTNSQIQTLIEEEIADKIIPLEEEYRNVNSEKKRILESPDENDRNSAQQDTFEQLPNAAKEKGQIFEKEETGQRYRSNGKKWIEVS